MSKVFSVERHDLISTAERFFDGYKKYSNRADKLEKNVIELQIKLLITNPEVKIATVISDKKDASIYFSNMDAYAGELSKNKKGIIFYNDKFVYGLIGDKTLVNDAELKKVLEEAKKGEKPMKFNAMNTVKLGKTPINDVLKFSAICQFKQQNITDYFANNNWTKF